MPQADEIELPAHMRQGFALAAEALKRYPIPQAMLGGGTVLAALWNHRDSTDLDFAVPRSVVEGLPKGTPAQFAQWIERALDPLGELGWRPLRQALHNRSGHGEVQVC